MQPKDTNAVTSEHKPSSRKSTDKHSSKSHTAKAESQDQTSEGTKDRPKSSPNDAQGKPKPTSKTPDKLKSDGAKNKPKSESGTDKPQDLEAAKVQESVRPKVYENAEKSKERQSDKSAIPSRALPSFEGLSKQQDATEALENLSLSAKFSSTPKPKPPLLSRVKDAEEWRDSSGYVNSDDSDDDCVILEEKPSGAARLPKPSGPSRTKSSSESSSSSEIETSPRRLTSTNNNYIDLSSSDEDPPIETKPQQKKDSIEISSSSSEDDSPIKTSPTEEKSRDDRPKAQFRKLPSGQMVRIVKKTPEKKERLDSKEETGTVKLQSGTNSVEEKKKEESNMIPEKKTSKLPLSSTGTLNGDVRKLNEVTARYKKHKDILNKVNVKALPDGGVKLLTLIKDLNRQTIELGQAIEANDYPPPIKAASAMVGGGQIKVNVAGQQLAGGVRQTKITDHAMPQHVYQQMYAAQPHVSCNV